MSEEEIKIECSNDVFKYTPDQTFDYIYELQQENSQLKNNWKELKEYCKNNYYGITTIGILDKIQELEKNK